MKLGTPDIVSGVVSLRASTSRMPSRTVWPLRRPLGFAPSPRNSLAFGSALHCALRSVTEALSLRSRTSVTEVPSMTGRGQNLFEVKGTATAKAHALRARYLKGLCWTAFHPAVYVPCRTRALALSVVG